MVVNGKFFPVITKKKRKSDTLLIFSSIRILKEVRFLMLDFKLLKFSNVIRLLV